MSAEARGSSTRIRNLKDSSEKIPAPKVEAYASLCWWNKAKLFLASVPMLKEMLRRSKKVQRRHWLAGWRTN